MKSEQFDFGASLGELEAITAWFEAEEVDLNQAVAKFERGMQLAAELKSQLAQVENRVEKIKQRFDAPPAEASPTSPDDDDKSGDSPSLFAE